MVFSKKNIECGGVTYAVEEGCRLDGEKGERMGGCSLFWGCGTKDVSHSGGVEPLVLTQNHMIVITKKSEHLLSYHIFGNHAYC